MSALAVVESKSDWGVTVLLAAAAPSILALGDLLPKTGLLGLKESLLARSDQISSLRRVGQASLSAIFFSRRLLEGLS